MTRPLLSRLLLALCLVFPAIVMRASEAVSVDHSAFDAQLRKYVDGGRVDYAAWSKDRGPLKAYLKRMAKVDDAKLPRNEKLALYINLYNAWTVELILDNLPKRIRSIKDIPSRWDLELVRLKGRKISLDHLEHKILRPTFKDARIHFAVNCASIGCPDLWNRAYTGGDIQKQLDSALKRFFSDRKKGVAFGDEKGTVWGTNHVLRISKIFSWFDDDFERDAKGSVEDYIRKNAGGKLKDYLTAHKGDLTVRHFDYDWRLNGK